MNATNRVLLNTVSQYIRTGLNVILSLYSTRIILEALGSSDYGLYSVIAGVVAMLSFVSNAFVISTQRYLSYSHGLKDKEILPKVFGNSLIIHVVISIVLLILLLCLTNPIVNNYLEIPNDRLDAAKTVYICVAAMIALTFITSPFRALFIARENIVYISIIDVVDGVIKVVFALLLAHISYDKLETYAILLTLISVFNLFSFAIYALLKYEECRFPKLSDIDKSFVKKLTGFAGWTLYSTGCVVVRTQGIAVLINRIFGVIFNASYGIAQQISSALINVSQAIANALSPQIIKAEGGCDRKRMLYLASIECKYAYFMLAMVAIPLMFKMSFILKLWLHDVPENAVMFCNAVIIAALCDTLTGGLGIAFQAIGKIKNYSLVFGTIKLITIPLAYVLVILYQEPYYIMVAFVLNELICSIVRVILLRQTVNMDVPQFLKSSIMPSSIVTIVVVVACYLLNNIIDWTYNIILLFTISILLVVVVAIITMDKTEKDVLNKIIRRIYAK